MTIEINHTLDDYTTCKDCGGKMPVRETKICGFWEFYCDPCGYAIDEEEVYER